MLPLEDTTLKVPPEGKLQVSPTAITAPTEQVKGVGAGAEVAVTVTPTPEEQLLPVLDSPLTPTTHAP